MSRVDTDNVDAALSEAKPQDIVVESKNRFVKTALGQLTGIKFTSINRTPSTSDIDIFVILPQCYVKLQKLLLLLLPLFYLTSKFFQSYSRLGWVSQKSRKGILPVEILLLTFSTDATKPFVLRGQILVISEKHELKTESNNGSSTCSLEVEAGSHQGSTRPETQAGQSMTGQM